MQQYLSRDARFYDCVTFSDNIENMAQKCNIKIIIFIDNFFIAKSSKIVYFD